ncbi:MmpS family transport accessory protein [Mycolicibacterium cosmeticum]|uniref:MmpS family transport accessory protein n=1 Tax=Mycolicibacterium cosmeticum TaxID=258533 RepID=UPI0004139DD4
MTKTLSRVWLPALVVIAVVLGSLTVSQLRSVFGSDPVVVTPKGSDSAADFSPKVVVYEVFGTGSSAVINYVDLDGKPQRVPTTPLPWSVRLTTTNPSTSPNMLAQSDGESISCRITVDDVVKDERTSTGVHAQTFCLVKSA